MMRTNGMLLVVAVVAVSACQAWVCSSLSPSSFALQRRGTMHSSSLNCAASVAEIIGAGRIGALLAEAGDCVVLRRGDTINPNGTGPIFIATRNDALAGIVESCPQQRREDLVFLQNGFLDNFLKSQGLLDSTQALLYLSVTAKGAKPVDGITSVNPEGLTSATGKHAAALAARLAKLGLKCHVVSPKEYRSRMFEKLMWISTFMLVGTAKGCSTVGQAGEQHSELIRDVVEELMAAVTRAEFVNFPPGTLERLRAYTEVVSDFPCGVKEFEWRNQYFYKLGCPIHNALLQQCAQQGKLSFPLPVPVDTQK